MISSSLLRLCQRSFAAFFAYLVVFGVVNFRVISSVAEADRQATVSNEIQRKLTRIRNLVLGVESAQRGFLLTKRRSYLESINDKKQEAERLFEELRGTLPTSGQQAALAELKPRVNRKLEEMDETVTLQASGKTAEALALVMTDEGRLLMDDINERITLLRDEEAALAEAYRARTVDSIWWLRILIGTGLTGFGVFTVVAYREIAERFDPLQNLVLRAEKIAQGDLEGGQLPVTIRDEIGIVTEAFNSMHAGLGRIFARTGETQGRIQEISSRLARSSAEQASSSVQQSTAVQETSVTLEELSQSATQIAERASEVGSESRATAEDSRRGLDAVQESIKHSEKTRQGVEHVASTISELSRKAQALETVVSSVNELAERSNILSISASIEAATAGAQGANFVVLANDMRSLADRSKQATVEAQGSLAKIGDGIHKAAKMAEEAVKRSKSDDQSTRKSEQSIRNMVEAVKRGDDAFQQIVAATRQQSHAFKQVEEALVSIQETATQAEKGSRELENDSRELSELSQGMDMTLSRPNGKA